MSTWFQSECVWVWVWVCMWVAQRWKGLLSRVGAALCPELLGETPTTHEPELE